MYALFNDLGRAVLDRWKKANFALETFPKIAVVALNEWSPAKKVDLGALARDFLLAEDQPLQTDSPFGEPELVVFNHPRFYIQLLFWLDGTTAIHQHGFSGAFHVMLGSSIHAEYEFKNARPVTPYLRVGDVMLKKIELLDTGATMPILSGQREIHSLFHLDSPSITVVVRTQHDPGTEPQFNYLPPHLAIDPHFSDPLMMRRKQLLDVLEQAEDPGYTDLVMSMISDLDFERGFSVLHHTRGYLQQLGEWTSVLRAFVKKHGILAAGVGASLEEDVRRNTLKEFRGSVVDPELRFFLALLMNVREKKDLLRLVSQRFAGQKPMTTILRWVSALIEATDDGASVLDASFPPGIDVDADLQHDVLLSAITHFAAPKKSLEPALKKLTPADLNALKNELAHSSLAILMA